MIVISIIIYKIVFHNIVATWKAYLNTHTSSEKPGTKYKI